MQLDDTVIEVGSTVYDLANGLGTAIAVGVGAIQVKFNTGKKLTYDAQGRSQFYVTRTLYAQEPAVFFKLPPNKNAAFVATAVTLHAQLRGLQNG